MNVNPDNISDNIDELLNSFIDGELTPRQHTEVQRLVYHDEKVAQRLRQLQKCKLLIGSLPYAEAPKGMLENIKAALKTRPPLREKAPVIRERRGARDLMLRKVLAAAAMIGLAAVLGVVIYSIVAPQAGPPAIDFKGKLELKTANLIAVDAFIDRAIQDNGLLGSTTQRRRPDKSEYVIRCSRKDLNLLLTDLADKWERFDSATLLVESRPPALSVTIEDVNAQSIIKLITPPKPKLTGEEKETEKPAIPARDTGKVELTIVVTVGE